MPKKFLKRYLPDSGKIRAMKKLDFLGDKLHAPNLWHLNRRSVSLAFLLGLWAMYTPLPFQIVISAALAIAFNANLPIAVGLVLITNPLTWAPMYFLAYKLGTMAMGVSAFSFTQFAQLFTLSTAWELGMPLVVGCLILMHLGAILGYFGVNILWRRSVRHQWEMRKYRNRPLNSSLLANETCGSYRRLLEHRHRRNFNPD